MQIRSKMNWKLYLRRSFIVLSLVIMFGVIYLFPAFSQENPKIYWTWHVDKMTIDKKYEIDVDYVTGENVNTNMRDGFKKDITVPDRFIDQKITVKLEPDPDEFKINGKIELTLQPSIKKYHQSWNVQPIQEGERKQLIFKYMFDSDNAYRNDVCYIDVI